MVVTTNSDNDTTKRHHCVVLCIYYECNFGLRYARNWLIVSEIPPPIHNRLIASSDRLMIISPDVVHFGCWV